MSFSALELNYLILRYLEECGLTHTAYLFARESVMNTSEINTKDVPGGALVHIVQKGLAYSEYEIRSGGPASENDAENENGPKLTLLDAAAFVDENAKQKARERLANNDGAGTSGTTQRDRDRDARNDRSNAAAAANGTPRMPQRDRSAAPSASPAPSSSSQGASGGGGIRGGQGTVGMGSGPSNSTNQTTNNYGGMHSTTPHTNGGNALSKKQQAMNGLSRNIAAVDAVPRTAKEISKSAVKMMKMHDSEVFICAWNPKRDMFGTGSGDSTARIWNVEGSELPSVTPEMLMSRSVQLRHSSAGNQDNDSKKTNKDVTSIDWNSEGTMLATGCYDGLARIWSTEGKLVGQLGSHKGPIFALRWNERGNHILSAGVDKTTIIWDSSNHREKQIFNFHSSSALDVDWMTDDIFVSCSTDTRIHVCQLGKNQPLRTFHGHTSEVNAVRYDKYSQRIASCSDDHTLKIWSMDDDKPLMDVRAHDKEIYTIRWAPYGFTIASASFDNKVRLWDVEKKKLMVSLEKHIEPVYSVSFSPDCRYLASGSFDRCIHIWDLRTNDVVSSYTGPADSGGIFEVNWNSNGQKLGASCSDGVVLVLDVRHLGVDPSKRNHLNGTHPSKNSIVKMI